MVRYAVEWGGAGQLGGQGVTRETLKAGDHVIITGSPGRNPKDHRVRMVTLHRPKDGFGWGSGRARRSTNDRSTGTRRSVRGWRFSGPALRFVGRVLRFRPA